MNMDKNKDKNVDVKSLEEAAREFLDYCGSGKGLSARTCRVYAYDLKDFRAFAESKSENGPGGLAVSAINAAEIKEYICEQSAKWKVNTVKRKVACLRSFCGFLEEQGYVGESPFRALRLRFRKERRLPRTMELSEVEKILNAAYECSGESPIAVSAELLTFMHLRDVAILEMLFATGLRVHELCGLTFESFDIENRILCVMGKGQKERRLYVGSEAAMRALGNYLEAAGKLRYESKYIFLSKQGRPISCQQVRYIVNKYVRLAGISRKITPHVFRHTFASLLLEEGVDIKYIQEFLGHSSISTTQIYLHTSERKKREILTNLHPRRLIAVRNAGARVEV